MKKVGSQPVSATLPVVHSPSGHVLLVPETILDTDPEERKSSLSGLSSGLMHQLKIVLGKTITLFASSSLNLILADKNALMGGVLLQSYCIAFPL